MTCVWRKFSRKSSDHYTHALLMALPYPDLTTPPTFHPLFFAEMVMTPNHKNTQPVVKSCCSVCYKRRKPTL